MRTPKLTPVSLRVLIPDGDSLQRNTMFLTLHLFPEAWDGTKCRVFVDSPEDKAAFDHMALVTAALKHCARVHERPELGNSIKARFAKCIETAYARALVLNDIDRSPSPKTKGGPTDGVMDFYASRMGVLGTRLNDINQCAEDLIQKHMLKHPNPFLKDPIEPVGTDDDDE